MVKDKEFYKRISQIGLKNRWEKEHARVKINETLSKEKIAIHAYLCGDGYIKARKDKNNITHYELCFALDDEKLCDQLILKFNREFNVKPKKRIDGNYFRIRINNKPICLHLLSLGKYDSLNWDILKNLKKGQMIEWIKCFFDCEAYVNTKSKTIQVKSINFNGLKEVQKYLEFIGINSTLYGPYNPKSKEHSLYGVLNLNKNESLKYKRLINFYHPVKKEKLNQFKPGWDNGHSARLEAS